MGWEQVIALVVTGLYTIVASAGFWQFFTNRNNQKDAEVLLLLALTRTVFINAADSYLDQGWIHRDDYEHIISEIYTPYKALGGNASVDRIMEQLSQLPLRSSASFVLKDQFIFQKGERDSDD